MHFLSLVLRIILQSIFFIMYYTVTMDPLSGSYSAFFLLMFVPLTIVVLIPIEIYAFNRNMRWISLLASPFISLISTFVVMYILAPDKGRFSLSDSGTVLWIWASILSGFLWSLTSIVDFAYKCLTKMRQS